MDENWFTNKSVWSRFKNAYLKGSDLKRFWKKISKENFDNELISLIDNYVNSKSYNFSSKFWNILNIKHINQIKELGIENFATTVAMSYFTFVVYDDKKNPIGIRYGLSAIKNIGENSVLEIIEL